MPLTPLHVPIAYAIWRASKKRLNMPSLALSAMAPDIEIPILYLLGFEYPRTRLVLHSIFGALVIVPLLLLLTQWIVRRVLPVLKNLVSCDARDVMIAAAVGGLSHVILDATCHAYNPLLWPLTSKSIDVLLLAPDWRLVNAAISVPLFVALVWLFVRCYRRERSLVGALIKLIDDPP